MPEHEKRAYERYTVDMPIWLRSIADNGEYKLVETANISAGGLLFNLDYPLRMNESLEVRFELPQNNDLVKAIAIVKHVFEDGENYQIGVQFESVKNHSVPALMAYLEALFK